jgi:hypothetical protein
MGKIKPFVQQTLGCSCPEEVFSHIDCRLNIPVGRILLSHKINVGNKLLIYIVELKDSYSLKDALTSLIYAGKKERDTAGFNRFRLVLASDKTQLMKKHAFDIFDALEKDERVHLHVVHKDEVKALRTQ